MPNTTQRYKIYFYNIWRGYELIEELNVRNMFEPSFYRRPMPTIGDKKCRKILKKVSPWYPIESESFLIENVDTGHKHMQKIYAKGTVISD